MSLPDSNQISETDRLASFIREHSRLIVLTGAGCSTESGIPEYRDDDGNWKHRQPMQFAEFVNDEDKRRRYWAQSFAGWHRISNAKPNAAHHAIAELERCGYVSCVITQNVDNLHTAAGSQNVIDLHGVLQRIRCLDCNTKDSRYAYQSRLQDCNPDWSASITAFAPDGDARISVDDVRSFDVPGCLNCGGIVKPDVVFFGEPVPELRVRRAKRFLRQSAALLVVGSSMMVFSGYRFARMASEAGLPIAIVNRGTTRADDLATHKLTANCAELLSQTLSRLAA
ncbi:MAG: NAD-dependent protein deacetylase [Proteobacteria bacterium]|nr:NAD-dependent protein deacetylase [Pseudomonadota bacterium]